MKSCLSQLFGLRRFYHSLVANHRYLFNSKRVGNGANLLCNRLDFLAGNQDYNCTPWGNPTRNVFGWQKPCYLLADEGYAASFNELLETTPWEKYGNVNNPKCASCMAHCGYEATAVEDMLKNPLKGLLTAIRGVKTEGDMVSIPTPVAPQTSTLAGIPIKVESTH